MALSGSISSPPVTFGNYIRLDWERIATNTPNRTSTIRYRLYLVLVTGSWVDATESFSISTMDGSSNGSRGVTYRGPGGSHLIHEYTNTVTHYDGNPVTLGAMATLRSGWPQLGTVITNFGTWTLDAMTLPGTPNTKYWVGGTGTWDNTAGSKWSTSPGGAGGASVPQPNEDVVITGAGTVTLGIDTPAVRQLTVGAPINLNGKTVTCARAQFNMQHFSLGSATINAYSSISFSTQTLNFGTGTLRVTHGSTLTIGGSPYSGGFHISPWTDTVTAGTSTVEINANPGTGNSMDIVLGTHTYNIMKIIIGGASTGAVSAAISGSPTFRSFIIQSKNSAAHTVNFDAGATITATDEFVASGTTSNNLSLRSSTSGTKYTLTSANDQELNEYLDIKDSTATGGGSWIANDSVDSGNNTGWSFVSRNAPPTTTLNSPANNVSLTTTTPTLAFTATDPEGDDVSYQVQMSKSSGFPPPIGDNLTDTRLLSSSTDSGFSGSDPYTSGTQVTYTVQTPLTQGGVDYWWIVRAKDPSGSNSWGEWSVPRKMTTGAPGSSGNFLMFFGGL